MCWAPDQLLTDYKEVLAIAIALELRLNNLLTKEFDMIIFNEQGSNLRKSRNILFGFLYLFGFFLSQQVLADCNCESTDGSKPCLGQSISVNVTGQKNEDFRKVSFSWAFKSGGANAACGQFANGDYWIAPAPGQNDVSITEVKSSGGGALYVDENPTIDAMGFLSNDYGNLSPSENILTGLPKSFSSNTSLVAAIQRNESQNGACGTKSIVGSCVDAYNVVTILDSIPENAGSSVLRPNISRTTKDLLSWNDIDLSRLPSKAFFDGGDSEELDTIRTTWSHQIEALALRKLDGSSFSEGGRAFRADLVTDDYATTVAQHWHTDLMTIFSSQNSFAQKQSALAAMIIYGKDIYFSIFNEAGEQERIFGSGAGQWLGRYPAAVFFAAMTKDPQYGAALKVSSSRLDVGANEIQELSQLHRGPNGPVWGDKKDIYNQYDLGRYWGEMLAYKAYEGASGESVKFGKKTFRDPYALIDGPGSLPGSLYASVSAGPIKSFAAAMLLIPQMCEIVNNDSPVDYAIRITSVGLQTANDECAPPDPRETSCDTYRAEGCKYYGLSNTGTATWGPNPNDLTQCIKNGIDPITNKPQTGRFSSKHGQDFDIGYSVYQVENNWEAILAGRNSCRPLKLPLPPTGLQIIK